MLDLDSLFREYTKAIKYPTIAAELDAIAAGQKAMSQFAFAETGLGQDDEYHALCAEACRRGLSAVCVPCPAEDPRASFVRIFVLTPREMWRVPAYLTLWESADGSAWSEIAEVLESTLLGYNRDDIELWMARQRDTGRSFDGSTVYMLLVAAQVQAIGQLGGRALAPDAITAPLTLFHPRWPRAVRDTARNLLPDKTILTRCVVDREFFQRWFQPAQHGGRAILTATLDPENIPVFNRALKSEFQFLTEQGWAAKSD